ncbi:MAG: glycosyltransferase family 4 protein [Candidatus Omnitrophota bacterium]|jgi:glycosyltransferase involved in cell wall biosynthesis
MKLKIAIVVHGRFDAFDLARAFINRGHDLTLFTNYPKWAVAKFGIPKRCVRSFWFNGILFRMNQQLRAWIGCPYFDEFLHSMFGRWAAQELAKSTWDIIDTWSGVSAEILNKIVNPKTLKFLVRGSSHIEFQYQILREEEERTGGTLDIPSPWMRQREKWEYKSADAIRVLSSFAYRSFLQFGVAKEKIACIPSAVPVPFFRPDSTIVSERIRRIKVGLPLRILYVGTVCYRKGLKDLITIIKNLDKEQFQIRLVGPVAGEAIKPLRLFQNDVIIEGKKKQSELPQFYAWGDVFLFPTIEDGYPAVLAQAYASALPILMTTNCSGPDLIKEGESGWVLPIRSPEAFVDRLKWCDNHRNKLAVMVERIYSDFHPREWNDVVYDVERFYACWRGRKNPASPLI